MWLMLQAQLVGIMDNSSIVVMYMLHVNKLSKTYIHSVCGVWNSS